MLHIHIAAIRGRSNGEWDQSEHFQKMEIGGEFTNSITSVAKDNYVVYEY